jgi:hypothetical protein
MIHLCMPQLTPCGILHLTLRVACWCRPFRSYCHGGSWCLAGLRPSYRCGVGIASVLRLSLLQARTFPLPPPPHPPPPSSSDHHRAVPGRGDEDALQLVLGRQPPGHLRTGGWADRVQSRRRAAGAVRHVERAALCGDAPPVFLLNHDHCRGTSSSVADSCQPAIRCSTARFTQRLCATTGMCVQLLRAVAVRRRILAALGGQLRVCTD